MKTDKFKPRITIQCDLPLSNVQFSKIKRVATMLEMYDMDVLLNIKVEEYERLHAIPA
jgi:hypothetical protein